MVVPPAAVGGTELTDLHDAPSGDKDDGPRRSARFRWILLVVLVGVLLAGAGSTIWLLATRGGDGEDAQTQRDAVMAQAEQFMLRVNTYGPDLLNADGEMPKYRALVEEVITPKFKASFEQGVTAAEQTVEKAGVGRTCEIFSSGVEIMDADTARVLVAGSLTNSYPTPTKKDATKRQSTQPVPFRVRVSLVYTGGSWLVDDFAPVTGGDS